MFLAARSRTYCSSIQTDLPQRGTVLSGKKGLDEVTTAQSYLDWICSMIVSKVDIALLHVSELQLRNMQPCPSHCRCSTLPVAFLMKVTSLRAAKLLLSMLRGTSCLGFV